VVEDDVRVLGPGQNVLDGVVGGLGVEIGEAVAAFGIEPDLLQGVDARPVHLEDDRGVAGVSAHQPADVEGLAEHLVADLEERLLVLREIFQKLVDLDAVGDSLDELDVGEARHLVDEGDLLL
jgi:hypothetical protein